MIDRIKKGEANTIHCWKANRLARNGMEGGELIYMVDNFEVTIITCFGTFTKENSNHLWGEFEVATKYSKDLSEDVIRGMDTKRDMGWRPGLAPIGYRNCKWMDKGEKEVKPDSRNNRFELCRDWWELMLTGKYTMKQTVKIINKKGLTTPKGNPVAMTTAYRFFRNLFNDGYYIHQGTRYKGSHQPMVTLAEFNNVQLLL